MAEYAQSYAEALWQRMVPLPEPTLKESLDAEEGGEGSESEGQKLRRSETRPLKIWHHSY